MAEIQNMQTQTEAIVSEGIDKGELRKVCSEPDCTVHHPKKQRAKANASFKAEQERRPPLGGACERNWNSSPAIDCHSHFGSADEARSYIHRRTTAPLLDEKWPEMVAQNRSIKAKDANQVPNC